jgi:EAL domain-containing protein (putative c-di-GMP-specific phosphodiesterase class I)
VLQEYCLPPSALQVEITESVLMTDSNRAKEILQRLHRIGIQLSIDDYGTGYSSLAYLQDLPVDELKLDRAFVVRLRHDPRTAAIVRSSIDLGHSLGLRVVAEGVEDAETLRTLARFGCDTAQGYQISAAMPVQALMPWLQRWDPTQIATLSSPTGSTGSTGSNSLNGSNGVNGSNRANGPAPIPTQSARH